MTIDERIEALSEFAERQGWEVRTQQATQREPEWVVALRDTTGTGIGLSGASTDSQAVALAKLEQKLLRFARAASDVYLREPHRQIGADWKSDEWRERRKEELVYVSARWDHSVVGQRTAFNEFMEQDRFVRLSDGQAVLVAIGALEEDETDLASQVVSFSVSGIACKLGWSIGRTLDGLSLSRERELVEVM